MRIYFTYYGADFSKYDISKVSFDYIQFTTKDGRNFIIEATGDLGICLEKTIIDGRFIGDLKITDKSSAQLKEGETIASILADMDHATFRIGLLDDESDVGPNPIWEHIEVFIETGTKHFTPIKVVNNNGVVSASSMEPKELLMWKATIDILEKGKR